MKLLASLALVAATAGIPPATVADGLPARLSEAGLFAPGSTTAVRPDHLPFSPQYPLWSDGTTKRRWIRLPPGGAIDAANPVAWEFPPGTRLVKEFSLGRRIETRVIERGADGAWRYGTYVWNEDGSDAVLAPESGIPSLAVSGFPGGRYSIPSTHDCRACHEGASVPVLGFSALQLSTDRDPLAPHADRANALDLRALVERGLVRNLPQALLDSPPRIPAGSPIERAALGYLHGNCAHCHGAAGEGDASVPVGVTLAQDAVDTRRSTRRVLLSLVGASSRFRPAATDVPMQIVMPGRASQSVLVHRMRSRDPFVQMPPLGTAVPDLSGLALIERWISEQAPLDCPPLMEEPTR